MIEYSIANWDDRFEVSQSKKASRLSWVALKIEHSTRAIKLVLEQENGAALYGAWILMIQMAAECIHRGTLSDELGPYTTQDMERITGCSASHFESVIELLSNDPFRWIVVNKVDGRSESTPSTLPPHSEHAPSTLPPHSEHAPSTLPPHSEHAGSVVSLQTDKQIQTEQDVTRRDGQPAPLSRGCQSKPVPRELLAVIEWWNGLKAQGLVNAGVSADPPSKAVLAGWKRVTHTPHLQEALRDRGKLTQRISKSRFLQTGWFTLEKLLGARNKDQAYIVDKILEGAYADSEKHEKEACGRVGPGQHYDGT